MRTITAASPVTTATLVCSLIATGCAPIGQHHQPDEVDGPDAGSQPKTCDEPTTKTMDLTLSSSTTVGNLPTGCWKLNGKLTVSGSIASLSSLGDLREVKDLVIDGGQLTRIDTAMPLEVTRSVDIKNTTMLTDLGNLAIPQDTTCLTYLASISVVANSALVGFGGLNQVRCVSGAVTIQNNVKLGAISLDQARRLEGGLTIQDNTALTQVSLAALESVTGDFAIRHNVALTSIGMLPALRYMHGSMIIDDNDLLTTIGSQMTMPPVVELNLTITNNAKLTNLGQFSHLSGVNGAISVSTNGALDFCVAREVGCCVPHNGTALIQNNKNSSCSNHSWCYDAQGGNCYAYAN